MKIIHSFSFFFLLPLFLIAQSNSKHFISYDFGISATENFYYIPGSNSQFQNNLPLLNNSTFKIMGWNTRISFERKFYNFTAFKIGVEFARHGFREEKIDDLRWPNEIDGNGGFLANPDYIREYTPKFYSTNILIPIGFRLQAPNRKIAPYIEYLFSPGWEILTSSTELSETAISWERDWQNHGLTIYNTIALGFNYETSPSNVLFGQLYTQVELADEELTAQDDFYFGFGASIGVRCGL